MANTPTDPTVLGPSASMSATAKVPLAQAWSGFVPIELPMVFPKAKGPIPPVVGVEGQTGRWDETGRSRSVVLGDGARVHEQITYSNPTAGANPANGSAQFGYIVSGFSGPLGRLTSEAQGLWRFDEDGDFTRIVWIYGFRPTGLLARPVLSFIITAFWKNYMRDGMQNVVRILEKTER